MTGPNTSGPGTAGSQEPAESRQRRERLRRTFEAASESYEHARPDYPEQLFDDLIGATGIRPGDSLLEIGCASGKATLPLARRGFHMTCVELSDALAAVARRNLGSFPEAVVETSAFEDWDPNGRRFDLLFAATSWHWLDPEVSYRKAWEMLRPDAHFVVWGASHVFPVDGDPFFRDLQDVFDEIGKGLPPDAQWPRPGELEDTAAEIQETGLFAMVLVRQYDWERLYDADEYIALLDTFSDHIAMQQWQRDRLYGEIRRRLALRPDGLLRRHWGSVLQVARRLEQTPLEQAPLEQTPLEQTKD